MGKPVNKIGKPENGRRLEIDEPSPSPPPVTARTTKWYRVPERSSLISVEVELLSIRRLS